jgi:hypothetical protein
MVFIPASALVRVLNTLPSPTTTVVVVVGFVHDGAFLRGGVLHYNQFVR